MQILQTAMQTAMRYMYMYVIHVSDVQYRQGFCNSRQKYIYSSSFQIATVMQWANSQP